MDWELDPHFALHNRLSVGRNARRWPILAVLASVVAAFVVPPIRVQAPFAIIALILLTLAPAYCALHVIALERHDRLDLQRLTGRAPLGWMLASIFGSSWLLMAIAVPLLLASRQVGVSPVAPIAVLLMGLAVALVLLSTPQLHDVDGRLLLGLVLLIVLATVVGGWNADMRVLLIAGVTVTGVTVPAALRQMQRRRTAPAPTMRNLLRGWVRLSHSRRPEFSRSVLTAGPSLLAAGFLALPALIGIPIRVWTEWPNVDPAGVSAGLGPMAHVAVFIAVLGCSTQARVERTSGALDRIRLTDQRPWAVVIQMAAGDALPLVVLSGLFISVCALVDPSSQAVRAWPVVAALGLFAGLAEGLRGRKLGTYVGPVTAMCALWQWQHLTWWLLAPAALLAAAAAVAAVAGPARRTSRWNPA